MADTLTPLMSQYKSIKSQYPDSILLFRVGDFYEMFGEDAVIGAKTLKLTLTKKHMGKDNTVPLAGVPYHAVQTYMARLIQAGHKVAICDQMEDPRFTKGIVKRDVTRVITPGTVLETALLDEKANNFLASLNIHAGKGQQIFIGLAIVDLTTGDFQVTEFNDTRHFTRLATEFQRISPRELLIPNDLGLDGQPLKQVLPECPGASVNPVNGYHYDRDIAYRSLLKQFGTSSLHGFGCDHMTLAIGAAGAALQYLYDTQKNNLDHLRSIRTYTLEDYLVLDPATISNLEVFENQRDKTRTGSLLAILDKTQTGMGGRKLKAWLSQPLLDLGSLLKRQDSISTLVERHRLRQDIQNHLDEVYDLERLLGRLSCGVGNARDMLALGRTLDKVPLLRNTLTQSLSESPCELLSDILLQMQDLPELRVLIGRAIVEEPPISLKEGGIIKDGYSAELDDLRHITRNGKQFVMELEARERNRTGIGSLKVRFNNVFGYYIEITKSNLDKTPEDYERKQTLANAERFITPELKEWETKILGAEERIIDLEYQLFCQIREQVAGQTIALQKTGDALAQLDVLCSLAECAVNQNFIKPEVVDEPVLDIRNGRHPVVENVLLTGKFVPNDTLADTADNRLLLITGPNMAGKSTYIRQVALITLMAQIGSFVPAEYAKVGIIDRIFTRVGASDNLLRGQSTFMVEMNETANILNNATERSLLILDEIGRGTSTFDGLSIAWAVAEFIHDKIKARTLFATHYHELTQLSEFLTGIKNFNVAVREWNDQVIFLHKIIEGSCDRSYGIAVGRLAGLPELVIQRAKEVLADLEKYSQSAQSELAKTHIPAADQVRPSVSTVQLTFFETAPDPIVEEIKNLDLTILPPVEALMKIQKWQTDIKKR